MRQNKTLWGVHCIDGKVYHFYHFCSQRFWLCQGICPLLVKVPIGKPVKQSNPERHLPHVKDLCPPWWLLNWAKRYFIFIQIGELPTANATWGCLELRSFREQNFYHFENWNVSRKLKSWSCHCCVFQFCECVVTMTMGKTAKTESRVSECFSHRGPPLAMYIFTLHMYIYAPLPLCRAGQFEKWR